MKLLLPIICLVASTAHADITEDSRTFKTLADGSALTVDIYQPDAAFERPRPAIVFFFGGGWISGTRRHFVNQCRDLAAEGFVTLAPDYRTQNSHGTTPRESLMDAKSFLRWVRTHGTDLGIDPDRVALGGGSAGGHLAAATVICPGFDDPQDDLSIPLETAALILLNPVLDNRPSAEGGYGYDSTKEYFPAISPAHNVHPGLPPTLILQGTDDHLIPVETIESFANEMQKAGNRVEAVYYEGQPHGFFNSKDGTSPTCLDSLERIKSFLSTKGWITTAPKPASTVFAALNFPTTFELDPGETYPLTIDIEGAAHVWFIKLLSTNEHWEPNFTPRAKKLGARNRSGAEFSLEINGQAHTLWCRPYQMPVEIAGLRLYAETTRNWATEGTFDSIEGMRKSVRLSAVPAGKNWGPPDFRFPIPDFHPLRNSYSNSWLSTAPGTHNLYYHKGEDYGAVTGAHAVVSALPGTITRNPLPDGDGIANAISVTHDNGLELRYLHMRTADIPAEIPLGTSITAGQTIGRVGDAFRDKPQLNPHLHFDIRLRTDAGFTALSTFPYTIEAHLRESGRPGLALAGGYASGLPGEEVILDGTRAYAAPGHAITATRWITHDGETLNSSMHARQYDAPGIYAEVLEVEFEDGSIDRDVLHVRIYDSEANGEQLPVSAWICTTPTAPASTDTPIRLTVTRYQNRDFHLDWGDGQSERIAGFPHPMSRFIQHTYTTPGLYTLTLTDPDDSHFSIKSIIKVLP